MIWTRIENGHKINGIKFDIDMLHPLRHAIHVFQGQDF